MADLSPTICVLQTPAKTPSPTSHVPQNSPALLVLLDCAHQVGHDIGVQVTRLYAPWDLNPNPVPRKGGPVDGSTPPPQHLLLLW